MSIYEIPRIVRDGTATLRKWKEFRRQTGEWPVLSITASLFAVAVLVVGGGFLIWYSEEHQWSKNRFAVVLIAALLPFVLGWGWIQDKIYLSERQRVRHARKMIHLG
jgi:hypothetical protein